MLNEEEISELKRTHFDLEKRIENIEKGHRSTIVRLSEQLKGLIAEIESSQEKEKSVWNPAVSTRMRMAKRGMELFKDLNYFERWVAGEFENNNIPKDTAKKLIYIARLVKESKMQFAKKEFEYFEEITEPIKKFEKVEEEMKVKDRMLRKEKLRIEKMLAEMSGLEKEIIVMEKVRRHEELMKNLEKLKKAREAYLRSMISEPVVELLGEMEKHSLRDHYPAFPGEEELVKLKEFFSQYPAFGKCNADQLCEFFEYSEKKLSHICPETTKFRSIVMGNRKLFETIRSLEHTAFLAVNDEDEKVMDFFAGKFEGTREIVEQIRLLRKEKHSYREEYEKAKRIDKRKEELSKYSKKELEEELRVIESLLELLNSDQLKKDTEEKQGFLSGFWSFLRGSGHG